MTILSFLCAGLLYGLYSWLCFNPALKGMPWAKWAGLAMAILANMVWIFLAHRTMDPSTLLYYGMVWDAIVTASSILIPVLFFGSSLTPIGWTGMGIVVLGILLMKLGA